MPINQESAATKRYLAGDIDITESFPEKYVSETAEGYSGAGIYPAAAGYLLLRFQYPKGPTADERVRLALSMTIDRRVMAEKVLGTGEKPAWRFTPDVTAGFTPSRRSFRV
ncbi:ABC transporter substrate-binding protein [Klebsiella variicola subsp. variicola]|nr:ABC transporter substrate-binding protein [Klebsiella variicola subsp. variicola]